MRPWANLLGSLATGQATTSGWAIAATLAVGLIFSADAARADTLSFECHYPTSVAANLSPNTANITTDLRTDDNFKLSFVIDAGADKGYMQGNMGASPVHAVWGDGKVTFLEVTGNGTVQLTAVYGLGRGSFGSVHSRSTGGRGFELPSQYYGVCEVK